MYVIMMYTYMYIYIYIHSKYNITILTPGPARHDWGYSI